MLNKLFSEPITDNEIAKKGFMVVHLMAFLFYFQCFAYCTQINEFMRQLEILFENINEKKNYTKNYLLSVGVNIEISYMSKV